MSICSRNPGPQALQPQVADDEIEFQRLGHVRDDPDSDDNKSEKEAGAKEANSAKQEPCRNCFSWVFIARYCKVKHAHVNLQTNNNIEHLQEYTKMVSFSNSLLARSSKLTELCQLLETALEEAGKKPDSTEGKRVTKSSAETSLHFHETSWTKNCCTRVLCHPLLAPPAQVSARSRVGMRAPGARV